MRQVYITEFSSLSITVDRATWDDFVPKLATLHLPYMMYGTSVNYKGDRKIADKFNTISRHALFPIYMYM